MNQVPYWIQVLQALATPAIALLAVVIGVMQWRTNHQRAVLDLFDKRWEVLSQLRSVIGEILREGDNVNPRVGREYSLAADRASFLFGSDVISYLEAVRGAISRHQVASARVKADPNDSSAIDLRYAAFSEISEFVEKADRLVKPYMQMHQRAPWF
jgi:hypothetical protein